MLTNFKAMDLIYRINDFFDDYLKAWLSFNAKSLAHCYDLPCSFLSDDSYTAFTNAAQLEGFFAQGLAFYKQNGIAGVSVDIRSKERLTTQTIKVKLTWQYYDKAGEWLYDCTYYYIIRSDAAGHLKIAVAISVDEKEKLEAWLQSKSS